MHQEIPNMQTSAHALPSELHSRSELQALEPRFQRLIETTHSESLSEVAHGRRVAQRSYSSHSVLIPRNPVVVTSGDSSGVWISALIYVPHAEPPSPSPLWDWVRYRQHVLALLAQDYGLTLNDIIDETHLNRAFIDQEPPQDLVAQLAEKYDLHPIRPANGY
jgi:hypothetical protein